MRSPPAVCKPSPPLPCVAPSLLQHGGPPVYHPEQPVVGFKGRLGGHKGVLNLCMRTAGDLAAHTHTRTNTHIIACVHSTSRAPSICSLNHASEHAMLHGHRCLIAIKAMRSQSTPCMATGA